MTPAMPTDSPIPQLPCLLRYKRELSVVFMLLGGLNLGLGIWLLLLGELSFTLLLGLLIVYIGYGYFKKPMASVHLDHIDLYNLLGMKVKSYPLRAFSDLKIKGRHLQIQQGETSQSVKLSTWMIHSQDWQKLETLVSQAQDDLGSSLSQLQAK